MTDSTGAAGGSTNSATACRKARSKRRLWPTMTEPPRPLAAIDVGTNSVHLVVARPTEGGAPEILARIRSDGADAAILTAL